MSDPIGDGMEAFAEAVVVVCRAIGGVLTFVLGGGTMLLFVILTSPIWLTGLAIKAVIEKRGNVSRNANRRRLETEG